MDKIHDKSEYTEEFEHDSSCRTHENVDSINQVNIQSQIPRPSSQQSRNLDILSNHSLPSLANSDDFESPVKLEPRSRSVLSQATTRYSQDSFDSSHYTYSQTFESLDGTKTWLGYSQDTFEDPDSDVEQTTSSYSRESVLKSPRKSQDLLSDTDNTSCSSVNHTHSETSSLTEYDSDSDVGNVDNGAKSDFISKKIQLLNLKRAQPLTFKNSEDDGPGNGHDGAKSRTTKHLKKFCERKLELLRNKVNNDHDVLSGPKEPVSLWNLRKGTRVAEYGISPLTISRLKAHNTLGNMKKAASIKVHDPKKCKSCRKNVSDMAHKDFLKHKLAIASEKLIDERITKQLYKYTDPISMMKEGLEELPKLSDDPDEIFQRLCKPLYTEQSLKQHSKVGSQLIQPTTQETFNTQYKDRFWERYFQPLETCSWFPSRNKVNDFGPERTEHVQEEIKNRPSERVGTESGNGKSSMERLGETVKEKPTLKLAPKNENNDSDFSLPSSCSASISDDERSDLEELDIKKYNINSSQDEDSSCYSSSESEDNSPVHKVHSLADITFDDESVQDEHLSKNEELVNSIGKDNDLFGSSDAESYTSGRHSHYSETDILDGDKFDQQKENSTSDKDISSSDSEFGVNVYSIGDLSL